MRDDVFDGEVLVRRRESADSLSGDFAVDWGLDVVFSDADTYSGNRRRYKMGWWGSWYLQWVLQVGDAVGGGEDVPFVDY